MKSVSQRELRTLFRALATERCYDVTLPFLSVISKLLSGASTVPGPFSSTWDITGDTLNLQVSKRYGNHSITVRCRM